MNRVILLILFLGCGFARAQYNNEWIDYNKTYYKFPVIKNTLHRISKTSLQNIGLENVPAEQFQLWRNGVQVPIYTSVTSGVLGASDFIEFWGEMNDGKPDKNLYPNINDQLNEKWSLETDTSSYFLTVNPAGNNLRLTDQTNNVAGNVLPEEPYFMFTTGKYFKNKINSGYAQIVSEYVYSSVYDKGEGWTSDDIRASNTLTDVQSKLFPYTTGPDATLFVAAAGNAVNNRSFNVKVNGTQLISAQMDAFSDQRQSATFPVSLLNSGSATVAVTNVSANPNDRMVVAKYEITYPRLFNFGDSSYFQFDLPATTNGNYLKITFKYGTVAPVLYDLTNFKRYIGVIDEAGIAKFALLPSLQNRKLVLVSQESGNLVNVASFTTRNFVNYSLPENQGDFIIISNPRLYNGANGNPVLSYAQYRASAAGGGHNAKVYDIDQLTDQFAFGIKRHPFAIKKFLKYARSVFSVTPSNVFLIGKGVSYMQARLNEGNPLLDQLNLIPPFGYPASDNLLSSNDNETIAAIPIGRLSAVSPAEVEIYLEKVKEFESVGVNTPQTIEGRAWMKNIVHAIGGGNAQLSKEIGGYMNQLKQIAEDTLWGANVESFSNSSAVASQLTSDQLKKLFNDGIGIVNYFGHSSASTTEFNIDDPSIYENQGKYPLFLVNGCLAGDIFNLETNRLNTLTTLSEKYLLNPKGAIGFVASTHYGIVSYLNIYLHGLYKGLSGQQYGKPIGKLLEESFRYLLTSAPADYLGRLHAEEITLDGDPSIKLYMESLPDFAIEDQFVYVPSLISIADNQFKYSAKYFNLGISHNDSMQIEIKRQLPDGSIITVFNKKVRAANFSDSLELIIPINPAKEKGENKLIITLDSKNEITETSETNNSVSKTFYIVDDGARTIYPYEYSIVSNPNIKFYASSSNPLAPTKSYVMEIDTTELYNSPFKKSITTSAAGGIIEFDPGISFSDSTVYYWRVSAINGGDNNEKVWSSSSFTFLNNHQSGYSQAHYFQFLKDTYNEISLDEDRVFRFDKISKTIKISTGLYPYYLGNDIYASLDGSFLDYYGCLYSSLQFIVYDSLTLQPWKNFAQGAFGLFGSVKPCGHNKYAFEFQYSDTSYRRKAIQFLESIPAGNYVSITNLGMSTNSSFIDDWKSDTAKLGSGRSLYHVLKNAGIADIDKFTTNLPFLFFFKKGDSNFPVQSFVGQQVDSKIVESFNLDSRKESGTIESEWFGPAETWERLRWKGKSIESDSDKVSISVYGKDYAGNESLLTTVYSATDTSISFINAAQYPFLKLKMLNSDTIHGTPSQLRNWMLTGKLPPEGAIASNIFYSPLKDTVEIGEILNLGIAFKNISPYDFDSLKIKLILIDNNNVQHIIDTIRRKPLISGDTIKVVFTFNTAEYPGSNTIYLSFNPDNDQVEQYFFNNFLYKNVYVKPDKFNPLLDVTFDGVHILNNDIVSSKPHILINLKDNNRYLALDDTALIKVQVKYPNGILRSFNFNSDTLRFTPPNLSSNKGDNTAVVDFNPSFLDDGDYELLVSGKDKSGNSAGITSYKVSFKIINKPMISNMFNYPNPFTTSTAFVFTLTGSEVPQNLRIQILTITGKIVKEITKTELGPIRIGRNITDYKWDGTDQFGQKLANGVYLYRVITNLNGKSLDRYKVEGDTSDKYFNKGYGKMYLMR
ncbi:MAG: hypothetical protein JST63_04260 [Bacteroidetes bacterium]|nr:hypothetical protein [Bacteroidota bacterium]